MKISWVFDVISPFAYLNLQQLDGLPADVTVDYVPVLFAGLLNHHGQIGPAEIASKRRFTYRFALWRARKMGIPMRFPPAHPFNPLYALRLIIAAGNSREAICAVFDAIFKHGRDVADTEVLNDVARQLHIRDWQQAIAQPDVKDKLRANTDWAITRGIFGVPTFIVDNELFWGHDAFEMVLDYLRAPAEFNDAEMQRADALPVGVSRQRK